MNKILLLIFLMQGCSSLDFTRPGHSFEGTGHATSALICTHYYASKDLYGNDVSIPVYLVNFPFVGVFNLIDFILTVPTDIIRVPLDIAREQQAREEWDTVNHWNLSNCKEYGSFLDNLMGI